MDKIENHRVAFIHGRPTGHPFHAKLAKRIKSDFYFEDRILRWQDVHGTLKLRRYSSWILNAVFFPNTRSYSIFLTECIRIPQLVMKSLGIISKNQRLVALMDDESLYFIKTKKYSKPTIWVMKKFLDQCDALICVGKFQTQLAANILKGRNPKIYTIFNGIERNRFQQLISVRPDLNSRNIVFIGNVVADWRVFYKGLDLAIDSFLLAKKKDNSLKFILIGKSNYLLEIKYKNEIEKWINSP